MLRLRLSITTFTLLFACTEATPENTPSISEDAIGTVPDLARGSTAQTTGNLNLRSGPGTQYRILDVLSTGTEVSVVDRSGNWYSVQVAAESGWVSGLYLEAVAGPGELDAGTDPSTIDAGTSSECASWMGADFACAPDGNARGYCSNGTPVLESCDRGCLRSSTGPDSCLGPAGSSPVDCSGSWGHTKATDGDYYITAFGCWVDGSGSVHTDPGDNCVPSCLAQAKAAGVCHPGDSGAACEERVTWYTADGGRFGCMTRVRISDPNSGKAVVGLVLDFGPSCSVERSAHKAVLDASGRINRYLFGTDHGWSDHARVHVVEVDPSTPLGPVL